MLRFLLRVYQHRVNARSILLQRRASGDLSAEEVYALILAATGDEHTASVAKAKYQLDMTRPQE